MTAEPSPESLAKSREVLRLEPEEPNSWMVVDTALALDQAKLEGARKMQNAAFAAAKDGGLMSCGCTKRISNLEPEDVIRE